MTFLLSNRMLRATLAGAVILTGTACSRSDRTESGSDTSAAALPDTSYNAPQPSGADTGTGATSDTAAAPRQSSNSTQPGSPAPSNSPRAETAPTSDSDAVGYRPMERDTTNVPSQRTDTAAIEASAEVADSNLTEMAGATDTTVTADVIADTAAMEADTTAVGYDEMARDTTTLADQPDTAAAPSGDAPLQTSVDTSSRDSVAVSVETDVAVVADSADTATTDLAVVTDSADTTDNAGRIRPPADSTENLGSITTPDEAADETADEQIINQEDQETVAASETPADEVGAAAVAGDVTGVAAVALMSRQGVSCTVVDPEVNETVRWDMSSTPVTLNPCGMGSMVLSRIWTAGQRDSGTAGQ